MTTLPPEDEPRPEAHQAHPEPEPMPRWVPTVIGVVLVTLALLAVITGLRYRDQTLVSIVNPHADTRRTAPAPPGEPEAGASRVFSDGEGANVPEANDAVAEDAPRAEITGGPEGVTSVVRIWARRGMQIKAEPSDAVVYVNDVAIGRAREYDGGEEVYDFPEAGSYNVRLEAPGFQPRHYLITASSSAQQDIARIEARLTRIR